MDPQKIIKQYYRPGSKAHYYLTEHSRLVAKKSLSIAKQSGRKIDLDFLEKAAWLHDLGIFLVKAPEIGCFGNKPYICHGYLGRELLDKEGWPKDYGLVCERHVGTGITAQEIKEKKLPLPVRDMVPVSNEEKIICLADKFFSKTPDILAKEKGLSEVRVSLMKYGRDKVVRLDSWLAEFNIT